MRPRLIHEEPIVENAAEQRPRTSFESSAPPESSGNPEVAGQGSRDHQRGRPGTAPRGKTHRKPKAVHWETLLRSRPWPDKPSE